MGEGFFCVGALQLDRTIQCIPSMNSVDANNLAKRLTMLLLKMRLLPSKEKQAES